MLALLTETWDRIQDALLTKAGEAAYQSWLAELRPLALERSTCYFEAANRMSCDRVERLYKPLLEECLSGAIGTRITVHLTPAPESLLPDVLEVSPSRPVVDESNETAFLVLQNLLSGRRTLPSELFFFYGVSGVGKSFLMRWWRDMCKERPAFYDGLSLRKAFQVKVREQRVLEIAEELKTDRPICIDGIHRLKGFARIQRELLSILKDRKDRGLLTLLTSRWHPREIWKLNDGLESLLLSGFVAEMKMPGHAGRLRYLRALEGAASQNGRASFVEGLARDVKGSYSDLQRAWTMRRHGLDHERHGNYLQLIDPSREFQRLRDRVSTKLDVPVEDLVGKSQTRRVTLARQALAWLCVRGGLSQAEVGRHMRGRSRASISYSIKTIEKRMADSAETRQLIEGLL